MDYNLRRTEQADRDEKDNSEKSYIEVGTLESGPSDCSVNGSKVSVNTTLQVGGDGESSVFDQRTNESDLMIHATVSLNVTPPDENDFVDSEKSDIEDAITSAHDSLHPLASKANGQDSKSSLLSGVTTAASGLFKSVHNLVGGRHEPDEDFWNECFEDPAHEREECDVVNDTHFDNVTQSGNTISGYANAFKDGAKKLMKTSSECLASAAIGYIRSNRGTFDDVTEYTGGNTTRPIESDGDSDDESDDDCKEEATSSSNMPQPPVMRFKTQKPHDYGERRWRQYRREHKIDDEEKHAPAASPSEAKQSACEIASAPKIDNAPILKQIIVQTAAEFAKNRTRNKNAKDHTDAINPEDDEKYGISRYSGFTKEQLYIADVTHDCYGTEISDTQPFLFFNMDSRVLREYMTPMDGRIYVETSDLWDFRPEWFWGPAPKYRKVKVFGKYAKYELNVAGKSNTFVRLSGCHHAEFAKANMLVMRKHGNRAGKLAKANCMNVFDNIVREPTWVVYIRDLEISNVIESVLDAYDVIPQSIIDSVIVKGGQFTSKALDTVQEWLSTAYNVPTMVGQLSAVAHNVIGNIDSTYHTFNATHICDSEEFAVDVKMPPQKQGAKIVESLDIEEPKIKQVMQIMPSVEASVYLPNNSARNLSVANTHRQNKEAPPCENDWSERFAYAAMQLGIEIGAYGGEVNFYDRVGSLKWGKGKIERSLKLYDGTTDNTALRISFVKGEIAFTNSKAARMINAGTRSVHMEYNALCNTVLQAIKHVSRAMPIKVCCGYDRDEIGRMAEECMNEIKEVNQSCVIRTGDFSRFDSTINVADHANVATVMHEICPQYKDKIDALLERDLKNLKLMHKSDDYLFYATGPTSRCSGDPHTTVGNCIVVMVFFKAIFEYLGFNKEDSELQARMMCCGDDSLLFLSPKASVALNNLFVSTDSFKKLGKNLELESRVRDLAEASFLSGRFARMRVGYKNGAHRVGYVHYAQLGKLLARTGLTTKVVTDRYGKPMQTVIEHLQLEKLHAFRDNTAVSPIWRDAICRTLAAYKRRKPKYRVKYSEESYIKPGKGKSYECLADTREDVEKNYPGWYDNEHILAEAYTISKMHPVLQPTVIDYPGNEVCVHDGIEFGPPQI